MHEATDRGPAIGAWIFFAAIDLKSILKIPGGAVGRCKIPHCRSAGRDRFGKDRPDGLVKQGRLAGGDATRLTAGGNFRSEQGFADVNIAKAGDHRLIEQGGLDRRRPPGKRRFETFRRELWTHWLGAHTGKVARRAELCRRFKVHKPEPPGIIIIDPALAIRPPHGEGHMVMRRIARLRAIKIARRCGGSSNSANRKPAGHAQMQDQTFPGGEVRDHVFAATAERLDPISDEPASKMARQRKSEVRPPRFDGDKQSPFHRRLEAEADDFNFGQFRHLCPPLLVTPLKKAFQSLAAAVRVKQGAEPVGDKKFKAFISYSHADEAWGGWLQQSLERFRAPGKLAAALEAHGEPARLSPVFRDREDLPVAGNLNAAIQAALADSEFQIVLCSPNSATSKWVNEEIKLFHKLHGPDRVFALIIAGEPNASAVPGREAEECFPPALRFLLDADGEPTLAPAEPLAADARKDGDGKRYALLKVAAGMLGVGLDELVRRDAARRARQASTVAGASIAGMAATLALSLFAIAKSNEATQMRGKAENLIEFMLTDLKDKLEPVGSLDILESVSKRALAYYADQDPNSLDDDALARRAKAMMQLGTIDFRRNDLNAAQQAYETAQAATAELLRRAPNDPQRIFDHAQNVFYVGEVAFRKYDRNRGYEQNLEYLRLARRLVEIDGDNPKWRLELAFATSNLGISKFNGGDYDAALPYFVQSIDMRRTLSEAAPSDRNFLYAYAYAISWRAYAELERGNYGVAADLFRQQLAVYGASAQTQSNDFSALDAVVTAQRRLAEALLAQGDVEQARRANEAAEKTADLLIARDPRNANWSINASHILRAKSFLLALSGDRAAAAAAINRSTDLVSAVLKEDAPQWYKSALGQSIALRLALIGDAAGAPDAAQLDLLISGAIEKDALDNARFIGVGSTALADYERRAGRIDRAGAITDRAIGALRPIEDSLSASARMYLAALYLMSGRPGEAAPIMADLEALGLKHPDFLALQKDYMLAAKN